MACDCGEAADAIERAHATLREIATLTDAGMYFSARRALAVFMGEKETRDVRS